MATRVFNIKFDWLAIAAVLMLSLVPGSSQAKESQLDLAWNHYLSTVNGVQLQPGCYPKRVSPPNGIVHKGTVILIHGYSACPQQYFAWADTLAQQGFEVLMPLLPGHGRPQVLPGADDFYDLPTRDEWQQYDQFADQMNVIGEATTGVRVIGGLSVGAAIAVDMVSKAPDLYDRQILFSPYLEPSDIFEILKLKLRAPIKEILDGEILSGIEQNQVMGWGTDCEDQQMRGREGFCNFELGNLAAATKFGKTVLQSAHQVSHVETQVIFVEEDSAADNGDQVSLIQKLGGTPTVGACTLPMGVNHSSFSRYDLLRNQDGWWIPGLLQQATEFVTNGQQMPLAGLSIVKGFHQCDVGCAKDDAAKNHCSL